MTSMPYVYPDMFRQFFTVTLVESLIAMAKVGAAVPLFTMEYPPQSSTTSEEEILMHAPPASGDGGLLGAPARFAVRLYSPGDVMTVHAGTGMADAMPATTMRNANAM